VKDEKELIADWQEKLRASFGDAGALTDYLFTTLDNFYYRYLETTASKDLRTSELSPGRWGALSFEPNMVEALRAPNPKAKPGIIELAKRVPKAEAPMVRYGLWVELEELTADHGRLTIVAEINWGFPEFTDASQRLQERVKFQWEDLAVFRKQLALRLEEACGIFLP
jgi:hypothetical protein